MKSGNVRWQRGGELVPIVFVTAPGAARADVGLRDRLAVRAVKARHRSPRFRREGSARGTATRWKSSSTSAFVRHARAAGRPPPPFDCAISNLVHARAAPKWNLEFVGINYPDFDRWQRDQKLFAAIAAYDTYSFNLADSAGADRVTGLVVTWDFFKVLAVEPILGRSFALRRTSRAVYGPVILGEAL